jgi:hypothetical protein
MAFYVGKPHWLYQQLKRKYVEIYRSDKGMLSFANFKEKIEKGSEFWFAGNSFKSDEKSNVTLIDKFKNSILS